MDKPSPKSTAFTVKANNGRLKQLITPVVIIDSISQKHVQVNALWDTGASGSVISPKIAAALNIQPTGIRPVNTANGLSRQKTFVVDIVLLNNVKVSDMTVTCVNEVMGNFDVLIGMDIISLGDFSVTNHRGITCMSFRVPSCHEIDYVKHLGKRFNSDHPAGVRGSNKMPGKKKKK